MRAERGEEAAMLLSAYQQAARRDAAVMRQRRRAIRTLFGVVGAVALFVGCIAVVDVFAMNGNGVDTMTLQVTTADTDNEAVEMEAQFGWSSIGYGWCSVKASTWCMFSKDKEKCKEGINCYKDRVESSSEGAGSGSGEYGNVTVGDAEVGSDMGSDEFEDADQPYWGGEEEGGEEEMGGEETGGEEAPEEGSAPNGEEGSAPNEGEQPVAKGQEEDRQIGGED